MYARKIVQISSLAVTQQHRTVVYSFVWLVSPTQYLVKYVAEMDEVGPNSSCYRIDVFDFQFLPETVLGG